MNREMNNMDRALPKKKFYVKYKYPICGAVAFIGLLIYVAITSTGASRLRVSQESIRIEEAQRDRFLEYVDVEGVIQPFMTIQVNTLERGNVDRVVAEEGIMVKQGDTILVLNNSELEREIEDKRLDWEKAQMTYREKEIEMEQKSLNLKQQIYAAYYELKRLKKSFELDQEEFKMGVKSKAQLEVSRDEYDYKVKSTGFQLENLRLDSIMAINRREMLAEDRLRENKAFLRSQRRLDDLIVRAPVSGQLSFVKVTLGQQVGAGSAIGEIKVMDQFKIHTTMSEFYIDRITTGLPATINYLDTKFLLKVTKVVPEVKDRMFEVDLMFSDNMPENVRLGKNYRVQVELGQPEEVITIPRGSFFQSTGGQWVFKLNKDGSKAVRQPVTIGRQNPQQYEIIEGLQPSDRVIVSGYENFGDVQELLISE